MYEICSIVCNFSDDFLTGHRAKYNLIMKRNLNNDGYNHSLNIIKTNDTFSLQTILTQKRPRHTALKIQILAWDRHKYVAVLNQLIAS